MVMMLAQSGFLPMQYQFAAADPTNSTSYDDDSDIEDDGDETYSTSSHTDANQIPTRDDFAVTEEESIVTINVMANDMGAEGEDQILSISNVSKPAFGIVNINNDGTITYAPYQMKLSGDSVLFDNFKYTALVQAKDGSARPIMIDSYMASVTIKVIQLNDPPIAYDANYENVKNSQLAFNLKGFDEDGNKITFSIISNVTWGMIDFDPGTGKVVYTPYNDNTNEDELVYTVSDGMATSLPASIKITTVEAITEDGTSSGGGAEDSGGDNDDSDNDTASPPDPCDDPLDSSCNNSNPGGNNTDTSGETDNSGGGDSGGAGAGDNSTSGTIQHPPVADAGDSLTSLSGENVELDGSASSDQDGDSLSYAWSQISGPTVPLMNAEAVHPSFTAPSVSSPTQLKFWLIVNDGQADSGPSTVVVTVVPRPGIEIDVIPGVYPNVIYKNRPNELVPVAILGGYSLSLSDIDLGAIRFGPSSAIAKSIEFSDVNEDGLDDLVATFRVGDAGLGASSTQACIEATVYDNTSGEYLPFKECDSVSISNAPR